MLKIKYSLALAVICSTLTSFPKSSQAQDIYVPNAPVFPDMCGYREAPCRRDSDGNIVDRETGDLYDKKGHLIQRNFYSPEQVEEGISDDVPLQWGAISLSHDTGKYGWASGYDDYEAAENAADQECELSDCNTLLFDNAFGAIAKGSATSFWGENGDTPEYYLEKGDTSEQAVQEALEDCQDWSDTLNIPDTCEVILIVGSKEGTIFQK
jgi:hypothetical protein